LPGPGTQITKDRRHPARRRIAAGAFVLAAALAPPAGGPRAAATPAPPEAEVLTLAQIRAAAPLETYRLERAYYDHLLAVARTLAVQRGAPASVPLAIAGVPPPPRPRLTLDTTDAPCLGPPDAAVRVTVVENLSQIYTQRLDRELQTIRGRFGERVTLCHIAHVQERTHRDSLAAAVAARCAHRQARFWSYRALLLAHLDAQSAAALTDYARELGLDVAAFTACVTDADTRTRVLADVAAARRAGIVRAPVVLIDGLYAGGAESEGTVTALVETALAEHAAVTTSLPESTLPFDVTGIVLLPGRPPEAIVVDRTSGRGRVVAIGDRLTDTAVVAAMRPDAVVIAEDGTHALLPLRRTLDGAVVAPGGATPVPSDRALVREHVATLYLDAGIRATLRASRAAVEAQFSATPLDVDGEHLLKLTGTAHRDLLARLGLEPGDVLMRVNDAWVFAGENTLVAAATGPLPATVVVMRRGFPHLLELVAE
jgi:predicted DsbA family dithiol-disulfide isomerase